MGSQLVKRVALVFVEHYLPGFKAGGPIRSVSAVVDALGDDLDFRVVTRDRDQGDARPYPSADPRRWVGVGKALVRYIPSSTIGVRLVRDTVREVNPGLVYLNGCFGPMARSAMLAKRFGFLTAPMIVAPRGELAAGATSIRPLKKRAYIALMRVAGLGRSAVWQATNQEEEQEIRGVHPGAVVRLAPNIPAEAAASVIGPPKVKGAASFVYLSRVTPKKNLVFLLEAMRGLRGEVQLSVVGPAPDADYLHECKRFVAAFPPNVRVTFEGAVAHDAIAAHLARHHFFVLSTRSENHGHAIVEAMQAGLPVVISDQTPWRNLEQNAAGWDLPLDVGRWARVLQQAVDMDGVEHQRLRQGARRKVSALRSVALSGHRRLFELWRA